MKDNFLIKIYYENNVIFFENNNRKRLNYEKIFVYDNNVGNNIISLLFSEKQCEIIFCLNEKTIEFHNNQKTFNILIVNYASNNSPGTFYETAGPVINYAIDIKNCYPIEYNISDYNPSDDLYPDRIKTICPFDEMKILSVDEYDNIEKVYLWKKRIQTIPELST